MSDLAKLSELDVIRNAMKSGYVELRVSEDFNDCSQKDPIEVFEKIVWQAKDLPGVETKLFRDPTTREMVLEIHCAIKSDIETDPSLGGPQGRPAGLPCARLRLQ